MKSMLRTALAVATVALVSAPFAHAGSFVAPEIDPSFGAGALVLLSGAVMVIRGRKTR